MEQPTNSQQEWKEQLSKLNSEINPDIALSIHQQFWVIPFIESLLTQFSEDLY